MKNFDLGLVCRSGAPYLLCIIGLSACEVELHQGLVSSSEAAAPSELTLEPAPTASTNEASPVTWMRLLGGAALDGKVLLFQGSLSSYDQGRIARDDLPATLLEREMPLVSWKAGEDLIAAPARLLLPDTSYTAAWSDGSVLSEFRVGPFEPGAVLTRVWPPAAHDAGPQNLFCGGETLDVALEEVPLGGADASASVRSAAELGLPRCVWLEVTQPVAAGVPAVLPQRIGEWFLEPGVVAVGEEVMTAPLCSEGEVAVPGACLTVEDDRLALSASAEGLWLVDTDAVDVTRAVVTGDVLLVKGLQPATHQTVAFRVYDLSGTLHGFSVDVVTAPVTPRIVISEVMANPAGPEPSQEWIELVNDGITAVDLSGWKLADPGMETPLPSYQLQPGEYVVLVGPGWEADPDLGAVPPEAVTVLELPQLGKSGLSNSGELLRLRDPEGNTVSKFPETPRPENGVSNARRFSHTLFRQTADIAQHAAPFSSPGLPNTLEAAR